jgi:two-component system, NtrC family, sensor kinase
VLVTPPIGVVLEHAILAAGPQGNVRIRVRQIPGGVEIAVSDSGAGIPRDELPRIFDPVFSPRRGNATGPGLSVAYGIVHGLGGDMSVESPPGEGATFRLRFPRRAGAFGDRAEK